LRGQVFERSFRAVQVALLRHLLRRQERARLFSLDLTLMVAPHLPTADAQEENYEQADQPRAVALDIAQQPLLADPLIDLLNKTLCCVVFAHAGVSSPLERAANSGPPPSIAGKL
jgi:hypothetical protein